jgi:hypothetical protein
LQQKALKIGVLGARPESVLGAGGRAFNRPAPTNRIKYIGISQIDHPSKQQVVASNELSRACKVGVPLWIPHAQFRRHYGRHSSPSALILLIRSELAAVQSAARAPVLVAGRMAEFNLKDASVLDVRSLLSVGRCELSMVVYDVMGVGLFHFWILRKILVQDPYALGVG